MILKIEGCFDQAVLGGGLLFTAIRPGQQRRLPAQGDAAQTAFELAVAEREMGERVTSDVITAA